MSVNHAIGGHLVEQQRAPLTVQRETAVPWGEVLHLGMLVSLLSAVAAVALTAVVDVSSSTVVLAVIVAGFAASWVRTGRRRL